MLVAHANAVQATIADLGSDGVHAAYGALIELAKGVARRRFDEVEPLLAPALAEAVKDLVRRHPIVNSLPGCWHANSAFPSAPSSGRSPRRENQ